MRSAEDEARPELRIVRRRTSNAMRRRKGTKLAALVRSAEGKPLNRMGVLAGLKSLGDGLLDVYRLHPSFGLFPAELEFVHPFTQVVTEETTPKRADLRRSLATLTKMGYSEVLVCDENSIRKRIRLQSSQE